MINIYYQFGRRFISVCNVLFCWNQRALNSFQQWQK